jgi:predicted DNA-binding protein with PD1-like motif
MYGFISDKMYYSKLSNGKFLIRLEIGEKVNESIKYFCEKQKIQGAWFSCIGSIKNPTLYHYKAATKKYTNTELEGVFEVTSLLGNVALFEGKPIVHAHVSISNEMMQAFGGHLVEAEIAAMLEIMLQDFDVKLIKKLDAATGLKVFNLGKHLSQ